MSEDQVEKIIMEYLNSVARVLPDSFETDDMLDEIRAHISESLGDKVENNPDADQVNLVKDVLNALGDPEEIAAEWGKAQYPDDEEDDSDNQLVRTVLQQTLAIVVVVAAAWFISTLPQSLVDFWTALIILMIFVVAEYFLRSWQKRESTLIEADAERKR
ncbi:MAG: HAAS signaling domain-containing protein [Candidatus Thorarchaeota archaeon]|jgi:uncharacterized membrane protein